MKRIFTFAMLAGLALAGHRDGKKHNRNRKEMPLLRTVHKSFKELSESEMDGLMNKFKCPNPKRPWQYWPLGCHHRHDQLKEDPEYAAIPWQEEGGAICTYYKKCLRNCRGVRSEHNKCINPLTQVLTRGIKCNCKCSFACIDRLNEIMDQTAGDEYATNDALLNDHGIVEISSEHQAVLDNLPDDTSDSDDGLIMGVSEDSGAADQFQRSASTDQDLSQIEECPDNVEPNGMNADRYARCHDFNWCHPEKFPCKYSCSRRCKECLVGCGACHCPDSGLKDGVTECPSHANVIGQFLSWTPRCGTNIQAGV